LTIAFRQIVFNVSLRSIIIYLSISDISHRRSFTSAKTYITREPVGLFLLDNKRVRVILHGRVTSVYVWKYRELPIVYSFISAFNSTVREAASAGRTASGKDVNSAV